MDAMHGFQRTQKVLRYELYATVSHINDQNDFKRMNSLGLRKDDYTSDLLDWHYVNIIKKNFSKLQTLHHLKLIEAAMDKMDRT